MIRPGLVAVLAVITAAPPARADRSVTGSVVDDATGLPVGGALFPYDVAPDGQRFLLAVHVPF